MPSSSMADDMANMASIVSRSHKFLFPHSMFGVRKRKESIRYGSLRGVGGNYGEGCFSEGSALEKGKACYVRSVMKRRVKKVQEKTMR